MTDKLSWTLNVHNSTKSWMAIPGLSRPNRAPLPNTVQNANLVDFRDFPGFGVAFAAPTGGPGGVARCHLQGLRMRYHKKYINRNIFENIFFFDEKNCFLKIENKKTRKGIIFSTTLDFRKTWFFDIFLCILWFCFLIWSSNSDYCRGILMTLARHV